VDGIGLKMTSSVVKK